MATKKELGALEEFIYLTLSFAGIILLVLLVAGGFYLKDLIW